MRQAWLRHIVIVSVVAVAFGMLQKPLLTLLSFIESTCLAHLSPNWFGAFVALLTCYMLKRERDYRKIYVPRRVSLWLILLLGIYLYYRHWEGSFSFCPIPGFGKLAWSDLLLLPWGGAVAITLRSRLKEDYWDIGIILPTFCALFYFVLSIQGPPSSGRCLWSIAIAVDACLLMDLILFRWDSRPQPNSKEEASKETALHSQAVDPDDPIVSEGDDWLGFSMMTWVVCENLQALDLSKGALTVGVIAPWGRGKSSFINLLRKQLKDEDGIIVNFNPRGSKSVSSIPEDFFDAFAKELSRHYLGFGLLLARYTKHIGLLNQYEWTRPLGSLLTLLLPGKEREAVSKTLRELGKRVYVLLDDLDRLSAEEILEVLKLMDRNASFSNTVFITAYDKAYVNNVLKKHLDHGLNHSFIDKYISWEFPLPESDKERMKLLMELLLSRKVEANRSAVYGQLQRGWHRVSNIVVDSLDSVRDLKRYLNLMLPHYNEVVDKVDCEDFLLLQLLRYKDLGVYVALHSRRLLQLDASKRNYVLTPSFEEDLKSISTWGGAKSILEELFPRDLVDGVASESCASLRSKDHIDDYFVGLQRDQSTPYFRDILNIVKCQEIGGASSFIDFMIQELGIERTINILLYLVKSPCFSDEDRAQTIELMAYVCSQTYEAERGQNVLIKEVVELFSKDRYERYKEFGVVESLSQYRRLLRPMLSRMIREQPYLMSTVIDGVASRDAKPFLRCVYSRKNISDILLGCQKSYYSKCVPSYRSCKYARSFIYKEYMENSPYIKLAVGELVSLIERYPDESVWMVLSRECDPPAYLTGFKLYIDSYLLDLLKQEGFSLSKWCALMKDSRVLNILKYVKDILLAKSPRRGGYYSSSKHFDLVDDLLSDLNRGPVEKVSWNIEFLPDEEVHLDSIDYIYWAVLAQVKKERQQATSEG